MVGDALEEALGAGVTEAEFWTLTPARLRIRTEAAAKTALTAALTAGWFSERFAREDRLQGPQHYLTEFLADGPDEALQTAMAEAELTRMAMGWGLTLEDAEDDA